MKRHCLILGIIGAAYIWRDLWDAGHYVWGALLAVATVMIADWYFDRTWVERTKVRDAADRIEEAAGRLKVHVTQLINSKARRNLQASDLAEGNGLPRE